MSERVQTLKLELDTKEFRKVLKEAFSGCARETDRQLAARITRLRKQGLID